MQEQDMELFDTSWRQHGRAWLLLGTGALLLCLLGVFGASAISGRGLPPRRSPKALMTAPPTGPKYRYKNEACKRHWPLRLRSLLLASERLSAPYEAMKSLHSLKCAPRDGDWLASVREPGETFRAYYRGEVNRPSRMRKRIYIMPLGTFSASQRKILALTARYIELFFSTPVVMMKSQASDSLPARAKHKASGRTQLLTRYILNEYLLKRRPKDAVATVIFTSHDLSPDPSWNFVYGEADLYRRIGVWSLYRMGEPSKSQAMFRKTLRRTIKIAVHELGHIFTLTHCIAYECVMNGVMHMGEMDNSPLALCPVCLHKICWNTRCHLKRRFQKLMAFCKQHKLEKEAAFFRKVLKHGKKDRE